MSRKVLLPLVSLSLLLCQSAFAQEHPDVSDEGLRCDRDVGCSSHPQMFDGLEEAAEQAHVERSDLLGALNKIQSDSGLVLGPFEYLYAVGELKRPISPGVTHSPSPTPAAPVGSVWDRLAQCESGGDWHADTGNGFVGGLQFTMKTWRSHGGTGSPAHASRSQQIAVAQRVLADQGWANAWPACSRQLGLR